MAEGAENTRNEWITAPSLSCSAPPRKQFLVARFSADQPELRNPAAMPLIVM